jgi:chorismate mutase/prephenate dehydratase
MNRLGLRSLVALTLLVLWVPLPFAVRRAGGSPVSATAPAPELTRARERIDAIDRQLLELLSERARIAVQIGEIKRKQGLPVHNAERERQVVANLSARNVGPLSPASIERIWQQIFAEMKLLEQPARPQP